MAEETKPEDLQRELKALIDRGLGFGACARVFADAQADEVLRYVASARERNRDGELEIDDPSVVSLSDDGGAYVMAWLWSMTRTAVTMTSDRWTNSYYGLTHRGELKDRRRAAV